MFLRVGKTKENACALHFLLDDHTADESACLKQKAHEPEGFWIDCMAGWLPSQSNI